MQEKYMAPKRQHLIRFVITGQVISYYIWKLCVNIRMRKNNSMTWENTMSVLGIDISVNYVLLTLLLNI